MEDNQNIFILKNKNDSLKKIEDTLEKKKMKDNLKKNETNGTSIFFC
jgi:hypothetical protein